MKYLFVLIGGFVFSSSAFSQNFRVSWNHDREGMIVLNNLRSIDPATGVTMEVYSDPDFQNLNCQNSQLVGTITSGVQILANTNLNPGEERSYAAKLIFPNNTSQCLKHPRDRGRVRGLVCNNGYQLTPLATLSSPGNDRTFGMSALAEDLNSNGEVDFFISRKQGVDFFSGGMPPVLSWIFSEPQSSSSFGRSIFSIQDIDGDLERDIVTTRRSYAGNAVVFLKSDGTEIYRFTQPGPHSLYYNLAASMGDQNNDGFDEIVTIGATHNELLFYDTSQGPPATPYATFTHTGPGEIGHAMATGDFNGDGIMDIFVGERSENKAHLIDGATLAITQTFHDPSAHQFGARVAMGDVTGDGLADLAVMSATPFYGTVVLLEGGTGNLIKRFTGTPVTGQIFQALEMNTDLDADGRNELIFSSSFFVSVYDPIRDQFLFRNSLGMGRHIQRVKDFNHNSRDEILVYEETGTFQNYDSQSNVLELTCI